MLPHIIETDGYQHPTQDVHRARAEAADQNHQEIRCSVGGQKADILKCSEAEVASMPTNVAK